jgi:septation ring formation regulator EzrA
MKKLDTTLFELDVVFETMSHATTWGILIDLKEIKKELTSIKNELIDEAMSFDENVEEVSHIEDQLVYINKNIRTFENALIAHETKIFEKRTTMGDLGEICLN